jgi:hypothetical protein
VPGANEFVTVAGCMDLLVLKYDLISVKATSTPYFRIPLSDGGKPASLQKSL